ncbi:MAG: hypothetical protein QM790_11800 [Nibricoccus sp.]
MTHGEAVSLNRCEQQIFEYIGINPEERHFWEQKVRAFAANNADLSDAAVRIDAELWRYFLERAGVVPQFKQVVEQEGTRRVSMRNLAEYLLRLWVPPRPKKTNV